MVWTGWCMDNVEDGVPGALAKAYVRVQGAGVPSGPLVSRSLSVAASRCTRSELIIYSIQLSYIQTIVRAPTFQLSPTMPSNALARVTNDRESNSTNTNDELKLPKLGSLIIMIGANTLLQASFHSNQTTTELSDLPINYIQISFFIVVSSSNEYAQHLGGTSTFSGVVIGIPTVFAGLSLLPLMKFDGGKSESLRNVPHH